ncbi:MAG TPA: hypothetical protein VK040_03185 [Balneolaceae bacterium]|nr:hypothetical protein [Balneolaceae bacterium]
MESLPDESLTVSVKMGAAFEQITTRKVNPATSQTIVGDRDYRSDPKFRGILIDTGQPFLTLKKRESLNISPIIP